MDVIYGWPNRTPTPQCVTDEDETASSIEEENQLYRDLDDTELEKTALRCSILIPVDLGPDLGHWSRELYINLLKFWDDHRSFARFVDLPPELRSEIYTYPFDLAEKPARRNPVQPAICQTSKQLRSEALPLFHAAVTVKLPFEDRDCHEPSVLDRWTMKWLEQNSIYLPLMRKLQYALFNIDMVDGYQVAEILAQLPGDFETSKSEASTESRIVIAPSGQRAWNHALRH